MTSFSRKFEEDGFFAVDDVIDCDEVVRLGMRCEEMLFSGPGSRNLLSLDWVQRLSSHVASNNSIRHVLPSSFVPVQCTYFQKTPENNWIVPLHRDTSIPVAARFQKQGWSGWSRKEGGWFVKPPESVLRDLVAVRVHLEENTIDNGALQLVPGSHRIMQSGAHRRVCDVAAGGAVVMRPLVLHSSSKLVEGCRRVFHFLYGPSLLPEPAVWRYAT